MQIMVCLKQILDPELPPREFRIDPATARPIPGNARMVLDSYAENALEMAIQLRDRIPGAHVTALCVGDKPSEDALRRALAFTANAAVRVWEPGWEELDGLAIAHILARAVLQLGGADLVLVGRQSGDLEEGLVGSVLADELGVACVPLVSALEVSGTRYVASCERETGPATAEGGLPAVCTVTSAKENVPRMPKVRDAMMARGKPIRLLGKADLDLSEDRVAPAMVLERAYVPEQETACEFVTGAEGDEQARQLLARLQELKVL